MMNGINTMYLVAVDEWYKHYVPCGSMMNGINIMYLVAV